MKWTKRPVTIDAIQWTGDNLKEVIEFTGKHPNWDKWFISWEDYETHVKNDRGVFKIFTLEGVLEASPGDWIIRGIKGEHYPCKPDIFEATYSKQSPSPDLVEALNGMSDADVHIAGKAYASYKTHSANKLFGHILSAFKEGAKWQKKCITDFMANNQPR